MYRVALAALLALPVASVSAASPEPTGAKSAEQSMDQMVCKRETVIGSRAQQRRICMTRREWIKLQDGTRDGMGDYLRRATSGAPNSG